MVDLQEFIFCCSLVDGIVHVAPSKIREACTDHRGLHPIGIGGGINPSSEGTHLGFGLYSRILPLPSFDSPRVFYSPGTAVPVISDELSPIRHLGRHLMGG